MRGQGRDAVVDERGEDAPGDFFRPDVAGLVVAVVVTTVAVAALARELGLDGIDRSMAYVGDAPSDGAAAKSAGMLAVGVNWGSHDLREEANARNFHVVFDTVEELAASLFDD